METIRQTSWLFETATFVVNCEANTAYASPSLERYFREHRMDLDFDVIFFRLKDGSSGARRQNPDRAITVRAGVWTSNDTKADQVQRFTRLLNNDRIRFHKHFTSSYRAPGTVPKEYEDVRGAIRRQMTQFVRKYKPPKPGDEMLKYGTTVYHGKEEDDFVMSLLFVPWTIERSRQSPVMRSLMKEKTLY